MRYVPRKKAPAKKSTRVPKRAYRRPNKNTATFAKKVQAIVSRNVENKTIQQSYENVPIKNRNSSLWLSENFGIPLSPQSGTLDIFQNVTQSGRIGNSIKIKKLTMKGVMFPAPYSVLTNFAPKPVEIKFWFGYQRNTPTIKPTAFDTFFQNGSSSQDFNATLIDMVKPTNNDMFRIFKTRTFKLGFDNYEHAGIDNNQQRYANNDFKMNHKFSFDLTAYVVKMYKYLDSSNANNMQRGLYLFCEAVWSNGSSNSLLQVAEVTSLMSYTLSCDYEDA